MNQTPTATPTATPTGTGTGTGTGTRRARRAGAGLALALTGAAVLPAAGASAAGTSLRTPPAGAHAVALPALEREPVQPEAAAAAARTMGVSLSEARARLAMQQDLGNRGRATADALAARSGGSYLDESGALVVTTLDAAADAEARAAGARPQRVDDSAERLDGIVHELDRLATAGAGGVQGWYVDVKTNTVVVTVSEGATDARTAALTRLAGRFGASVRVEARPVAEAPRATEWMVGGYEFNPSPTSTCSVGFNTRDGAGRNVVLTAGHCVKAGGTMARNGYAIGAVRTANFPGNDFGAFSNSYPGYWQPSPSVYKYNNTYVSVRGLWNTPPVGATVCKSGRTTGYTCGVITALNQTVVYKEGTIYGLVRHDNCVQGGDSGGANISSSAYALGVTSGASTTASGLCLGKVGGRSVSWYQPAGPALQANGLSLLYVP